MKFLSGAFRSRRSALTADDDILRRRAREHALRLLDLGRDVQAGSGQPALPRHLRPARRARSVRACRSKRSIAADGRGRQSPGKTAAELSRAYRDRLAAHHRPGQAARLPEIDRRPHHQDHPHAVTPVSAGWIPTRTSPSSRLRESDVAATGTSSSTPRSTACPMASACGTRTSAGALQPAFRRTLWPRSVGRLARGQACSTSFWRAPRPATIRAGPPPR